MNSNSSNSEAQSDRARRAEEREAARIRAQLELQREQEGQQETLPHEDATDQQGPEERREGNRQDGILNQEGAERDGIEPRRREAEPGGLSLLPGRGTALQAEEFRSVMAQQMAQQTLILQAMAEQRAPAPPPKVEAFDSLSEVLAASKRRKPELLKAGQLQERKQRRMREYLDSIERYSESQHNGKGRQHEKVYFDEYLGDNLRHEFCELRRNGVIDESLDVRRQAEQYMRYRGLDNGDESYRAFHQAKQPRDMTVSEWFSFLKELQSDVHESHSQFVDEISDTEIKRRLSDYSLFSKKAIQQQLQILGLPTWNKASLQDVFEATQAAEASEEKTATSPARESKFVTAKERNGKRRNNENYKHKNKYLMALQHQPRRRPPQNKEEAAKWFLESPQETQDAYRSWRKAISKAQVEAARDGKTPDGWYTHQACKLCLDPCCRPYFHSQEEQARFKKGNADARGQRQPFQPLKGNL